MRVAIVYNRQSQRVINLFGLPNRERYGLKAIKRITDALKLAGHQVASFEGDKDLIDRLEEFMPKVVKGERPGMVFNLSYGIQGQARYTHVPGILEMIGLPYVGSGPLAHSLALDKVVSKMIFVQHGLPTADFAVLDGPGFEVPKVDFPLIVKPKNEAVSFGIQIVNNEKELRDASDIIFKEFQQPVLAEQYIAGREINVGLLGNNPTQALPPAEIVFGKTGPQIYTYEDKTRKSGREIGVQCPAKISPALAAKAQHVAKRAFEVLGCYDCARVDMRVDKNDNIYILEVNSLPSLGEHGSYVQGAGAIGLDFPGLVNKLVEVAAARYFGVPRPPEVEEKSAEPSNKLVGYLSSNRDRIEREVCDWTRLRSRTADPVGIQEVAGKLDSNLTELGLKQVKEFTDSRVAWTWGTPDGFEDGTLIIGHLDVPFEGEGMTQPFRREPEWLHGEGIGSSRAPLVSLLFALRALRRARKLRKLPLGILYYGDEGRDCRYSSELIQKAAAKAKNVLVMRPGNVGNFVVTSRRGQRRYRVTIQGEPHRLGKATAASEPLSWAFDRLSACSNLSSKPDRISVATLDLKTTHMPLLLPHEVTATLLVSFPDEKDADVLEEKIRELFTEKGMKARVELSSSRPPMKERRGNLRLAKAMAAIAQKWEIPVKRESSVWPSVAGLAPASTGVLCGIAPIAKDLYTPDESVDRISIMQRTLLLAEFLMQQEEKSK